MHRVEDAPSRSQTESAARGWRPIADERAFLSLGAERLRSVSRRTSLRSRCPRSAFSLDGSAQRGADVGRLGRDSGRRQVLCQVRPQVDRTPSGSGGLDPRPMGRPVGSSPSRSDTAGVVLDHRFGSVGSLPSLGAPVPDEPMNSVRPSGNVRSRPFARRVPSFAA